MSPRARPGSLRWQQRLDAHCAAFLGPCPTVSGQIVQSSEFPNWICPHLPTAERRFMTVRTSGVSSHPMHVPRGQKPARRCELLIYLPADWDLDGADELWWPAALLRLLGEFVHEEETWFTAGHTVLVAQPGETYADGTLVSAVLLRAPIVEDPRFDKLVVDGTPCRFLWAFPITEAECDFKLEHGADALLALIDEHDLGHVLDPGRRCLVSGRLP